MVKVRKFQGWLADQSNVAKVISPPYDVLNTEEAKEMAGDNEMCFLHVNKPEIDLPHGTDLYSPEVYQMGKDNLEKFRKLGYLKQDSEARMYIYMQRMGERRQYGIVAQASTDDYEKGLIKRHELTTYKKEADRTKLTDVQSANIGPVFLTFKGGDDIQQRLHSIVTTTAPYADVVCDDEVEHCLWLCNQEDSDYFQKQFETVPATYIADGHHRAAAAFNVSKKRRDEALARGEELTGEESLNFFMAIHYHESQLEIMDYNRVLKSLNGLTNEEFLQRISEDYIVRERGAEESPKTLEKFETSLYLGQRWYQMKVKQEKIDRSTPVSMLDSQILTELVLNPILGITDIRGDDRIDFVGGIRGFDGLMKRCNEDCVAAFAMHPVTLDELMKVADAGMIMPPKSTWFEPKPRSGFVVRCFD